MTTQTASMTPVTPASLLRSCYLKVNKSTWALDHTGRALATHMSVQETAQWIEEHKPLFSSRYLTVRWEVVGDETDSHFDATALRRIKKIAKLSGYVVLPSTLVKNGVLRSVEIAR